MAGSVLIPAHDEALVLPDNLSALLEGAPEDLEVVVAANGCTDDTADRARAFAPRVRVVEIEEASKVAAIEAAEALDPPFPRIVLDADVRLTGSDAARLVAALAGGDAPAAEPEAHFDLSASGPGVRAFYAVWLALHARKPGDVGCGLYALSAAGRGRFGEWPRVISDDGFVRAHFAPEEILAVAGARSVVRAPRSLRGLVRIKARSRLGAIELSRRFPELWARKRATGGGLGKKLRALPLRLWPLLPVYAWVQFRARSRAGRLAQDLAGYRWERDDRR